MKLIQLQPELLQAYFDGENRQNMIKVDGIDTAHGVSFLCPVCLIKNNFDIRGVHSIICWSSKAPRLASPGPGRWEMSGNGFHDLTLTGFNASSSVLLTSGCNAHFFVRNGGIEIV